MAVCIWDSGRGIGGINHYMLPLWNGMGLPTPKYGNVAIHKLIERMALLGSDRKRLVAKVFGGAHVLGNPHGHMQVGERNSELAHTLLNKEGITIVASDIGGNQGRKILFNTRTGVVLMGTLPPGARV